MFNILVVEDEKKLRVLMQKKLEKNNYNFFGAEDGIQALKVMEDNQIDLIISDLMMPNMDGYELIKELRNVKNEIPIMLITIKDTLDDKKQGFLLGADDYMTKPVDLDEMILRVSVLLRRAKIINQKRIHIGDVLLNYETLSVEKENQKITLKPKEFYILFKLLSYPNKIYTRQDLMEEFWGADSESDPRTVDVHIKRIREKLQDINEFEIETIRGLGYKGVIKSEK